ncbi:MULTISPECIES: helix-turn-helix transcriptional regulator [Rhodococcus]|uniref:ArsR/SmtB family transcription factor n=1 Tax=Rhodococcus TaxID=1827 RepID=UPI001E5AD7D6|nr:MULTISPECIES: helix-turn-helix domain-containing protein [Rhodococcus]MCR8692492.1 helix-turn-helix domain-containing protein [Rhodococcus pyridinivorans]
MSDGDVNDEYEARLADLERRVRILEGDATRPGAGDGPGGAGPVAAGTGFVTYGGAVSLHGNVRWNIEYDAGASLALDPVPVAAVLDALGNPARLAIVRTLLRGPATATELQEATDLTSTGRLYHHLRALSAARVVEQESRNRYRIAPEKVVPLLVLTVAAADVGEQLR